MTVHPLDGRPDPPLAAALATFERQFRYPLGPGRSFSIDHGPDYTRFLRSMGPARVLVAERDDRVLGTLGVAVRRLTLPGGSNLNAAYIADLKIDPAARSSTVLGRLMRAADAWARPQVTAAYAVVMDGTAIAPGDLSGRLGVEMFEVLGTVSVLRLPTDADVRDDCVSGNGELFDRLSAGRVVASGGDPARRSSIEPQWLTARDGSACGLLADTAAAKRLVADDGVELRSAHLGRFAWTSADGAAAVVSAARRRAAQLGFPALFVAVPSGRVPFTVPPGSTVAGASVYGVGLDAADWLIDTSEI
jgi:GNAT superfamily N-acetyltransferase